MLKNHISHLYCEELKRVSELMKSPMARDESIFMYSSDVLREQFTGLVIQRGLPFNHFDDEQTTKVFQKYLQPKYNHVSRTTLKRDAIKLWVAVKQEIIDGFANLNTNVNLTTDVWFPPHGVPGSYILLSYIGLNPENLFQYTSHFHFSSKQDMDQQYPIVAKIPMLDTDKFWKKTGKKIRIQGSDVAGFDKSKVECFNCHKMGHFVRECRALRNQEKGRRDTYRQSSKAKEQTLKELMAIDGVGWDWSYMANDEEDHALNAEAPTEFALMANTTTKNKVFDNSLWSKDCKKNNDSLNTQVKSRLVEYKEREVKYIEKIRTLEFYDEGKVEYIETLKNELETHKQEKEVVDGKLAGLLSASKNLDNLIESQRSDKSKEGLGYTAVPPPVAQLYLSPKKDLSWTGLPECADDIVTDYRRPSPTVESSSEEDQNKNPFASENVASPITTKQFVKFVKASNNQSKSNISYLSDYEPFDGGYVSFGQGGCKITRKGTIKTGKLEFENVYFVKDLRDFKLLDDTNILLRTLRQHNMYSINLNNIVSHRDLTCLVLKASADECNLWHRRLGHLNFKTMNKLLRHNLVRGLPTKCFENDHNCTACLKEKQHKASCKSKLVTSVSKPLYTLHMDLFSPTSVSSISHKWYCLVVTDEFSRFTWTFFLRTKDETNSILRKFITEIENLKVKIIRCDIGGEFRNKELSDFYSQKGIKREFTNARTPQQNGVAKRRNRSLIEAARTMLADAKLPVTFWAEAVNTACYV
nr:hypothetical protein [Tanacetum cinerariifolium]